MEFVACMRDQIAYEYFQADIETSWKNIEQVT